MIKHTTKSFANNQNRTKYRYMLLQPSFNHLYCLLLQFSRNHGLRSASLVTDGKQENPQLLLVNHLVKVKDQQHRELLDINDLKGKCLKGLFTRCVWSVEMLAALFLTVVDKTEYQGCSSSSAAPVEGCFEGLYHRNSKPIPSLTQCSRSVSW